MENSKCKNLIVIYNPEMCLVLSTALPTDYHSIIELSIR